MNTHFFMQDMIYIAILCTFGGTRWVKSIFCHVYHVYGDGRIFYYYFLYAFRIMCHIGG